MYERFTDRARKVMQLANQEAERLGHDFVGTEHILLGFLREEFGVASLVLKFLSNVDSETVGQRIKTLGRHEAYIPSPGERALTSPARQVVDRLALEEAQSLDHNYVGTEHLLLALLDAPDGLAAEVLTSLGLELAEVRREVLNLLGHGL